MKPSYWTQPSVSERRAEIRLEGKCLENLEAAVLSEKAQEGWDQPSRVSARVSNLSAGGLEVEVKSSFPFAVDTPVSVELRFSPDSEWFALPSIVRHIHFVEGGCLVGMQFLWSRAYESDLEYRLCDHLLRLERGGK